MSFDFSRIAELSTARGKLVELKNSAGRVIWAVKSADSGKVILEVEKITSDTYAGETTYTGEQFILLDIYPKTNGTVTVTYGGLTKTITDTSGAEEPNAQQVFFGTFNGVTDEVETPANGTLTIEGDYVAFGSSQCNITNKTYKRYDGITAVSDFGSVQYIPNQAFSACNGLKNVTIPESVTRIEARAFYLLSGNSRTVIMQSTVPPVLVVSETYGGKSQAFYELGTNNIIVPNGCGNTYKTAEVWESEYADYITEAS